MNRNILKKWILSAVLSICLIGCSTGPQPIKLNVDNCEHCKMTVADLRFAAELITNKGRVYKFDDLRCMLDYKNEQGVLDARYFVSDHNNPQNLVQAEQAFYVKGEKVQSPMNGNVATFSKKQDAEAFASQTGASITNWGQLNQ